MSISASYTTSQNTLKVILLGNIGVGKTCLIDRFVNDRFQTGYDPTIGIDFLSRNISYKGSKYRLMLWDTAGQQKFKSLIPTYLKDAHCSIFVFDCSNNGTLLDVEEWIRFYREHRGDRIPIMLCGNKSDLENNFDRTVVEKLMEKYKMKYHHVSAKTGHNVEEMFLSSLDVMLQGKKPRRPEGQILENPMTTEKLRNGDQRESEDSKQPGVPLDNKKTQKKSWWRLCC